MAHENKHIHSQEVVTSCFSSKKTNQHKNSCSYVYEVRSESRRLHWRGSGGRRCVIKLVGGAVHECMFLLVLHEVKVKFIRLSETIQPWNNCRKALKREWNKTNRWPLLFRVCRVQKPELRLCTLMVKRVSHDALLLWKTWLNSLQSIRVTTS